MFRICKRFEFSASHQLTHLAEAHPDHQCARLHGHNYVVELELAAPKLDANGFVVDYGALKVFGQWIDATLDHRHLNDVLASSHATTAENLARGIFNVWAERLAYLVAVRVSETPKTWAEYRPVLVA